MDPTTITGFQHWLWLLWGIILIASLAYAQRYPIRRDFAFLFLCAFVAYPILVNVTQRTLVYVEVIVATVFVFGMYLIFKPHHGDSNTPQ